jgi:antagonist of KipI
VVDRGRPHCRSLGVPVGGAADRLAWEVGNALVGNPSGAAALEITAAGPTLVADGPLACVVYGAPFSLSVGGKPWPAGKTFTLPAGEELAIGGTPHGMRAYLCVRGGLQTPLILNSRSGLEPLAAGAVLPCVAGTIAVRSLSQTFDDDREPGLLRFVAGPQAGWFDLSAFCSDRFTVTPASSRMGLRLAGRPLPLPQREMVSEPVCPGSVQVTRDGQCIVLGVDGQTIGGYAKIAQVISADLDRLARLRPGEAVQFGEVSLEEAEAIYQARQARLRPWLARLRTADLLAP